MTRELADSLNRIGLVLGFFSFWFAAPEFIGEERLKAWEGHLAKGISRVPLFLYFAFVLTLVIVFPLYVCVIWLQTHHLPHLPWWSIPAYYGLIGVLVQIEKGVNAIVKKLANNSNVRQRALFLGAILFTVSFVLQFVATYLPPAPLPK